MIPMKPTPLSQLAVVSAGQGAPKDNEFSESGVPFVRAGSLEALLSGKKESELELVSPETAKLRKLKTYPKGTILFAKSGMSATKDRVYVLQNPAHVVSHLATLIPKDGAYVDYLRLVLKRFPPSSLIKDPAYPAIGLGEIENFEIPVPEEFDDQIRIAHLLGRVEGLIARRKQGLQQLDVLLKGVFLEMFGDPVRNEKRWEKKTAIDYAECIVPGRDKPKSFSGATPWVTTGDLQDLGYTGKSRSEIGLSEDEIKDVRARVVPKSSVLLTCVGDLGVVSICTSDMVINQQLHAFQVSEAMSEEFFMHSLSFQKKYMYQNASQTTLPYMNKTVCNSIPMICPPKDLQITFTKVVRFVHGIKASYQQSLTDLEALYGALSQQAFKGELDMSRVPMPGITPEKEKAVTVDTIQAPTDQGPAIHLPVTDNVLAALASTEARKHLLAQWLDAYRNQLGNTSFSVQHFMATAQTQLAELHPDNDFELGANDYECIKAWVFDALAAGTLTQAFDDAGNRIELKAAQA